MNGAARLLAFVSVQRGLELVLAGRNTRRLLARGAYESAAGQYPVMVALHAAWLGSLWLTGRRRRVRVPFLAVFSLLQVARLWVLATLGERWTTRIIVLPGAARIVRGPYRRLRHPNYAVVALELPCASLALGLERHAVVFAAANAMMLAWRIRAEDRAYARERAGFGESSPGDQLLAGRSTGKGAIPLPAGKPGPDRRAARS